MTTISTTSTTIYTSWHEDPNECAAFLDLLNIDSFVLEEAVQYYAEANCTAIAIHRYWEDFAAAVQHPYHPEATLAWPFSSVSLLF